MCVVLQSVVCLTACYKTAIVAAALGQKVKGLICVAFYPCSAFAVPQDNVSQQRQLQGSLILVGYTPCYTRRQHPQTCIKISTYALYWKQGASDQERWRALHLSNARGQPAFAC